jgi:hypothetical protein
MLIPSIRTFRIHKLQHALGGGGEKGSDDLESSRGDLCYVSLLAQDDCSGISASNMTLAAFTGTPVLDDGKVAIRSLAEGRTFMGKQQATERIVEKSQTDYILCCLIYACRCEE